MSGGKFDYASHEAEKLRSTIREMEAYAATSDRIPDEAAEELQELGDEILVMEDLMRAVEWTASGDTGRNKVEGELAALPEKRANMDDVREDSE